MVDVADLVSRIDIVEYIGQFIDLDQQGNEHFGLCPFHDERTPSFSVTESTQLCWCFSCNKGGNVANFIQLYHNVTFPRAVDMMIEYLGGDVKELPESLEATKQIKRFLYRLKLPRDKKYHTLDKSIMLRYDRNIEKLQPWIDEGIGIDIIDEYQVRYDAFDNRIVFPIHDAQGNIISVCGRTLDPDYKEKGIRKFTYYGAMGVIDCPFNYAKRINDIKAENSCIVFEAPKSCMKAETHGIKNSIALYTNSLSDSLLRVFIGMKVNFIFALDQEMEILLDDNIRKLRRFTGVEYIRDLSDRSSPKDAPIDLGIDYFWELYKKRRRLR